MLRQDQSALMAIRVPEHMSECGVLFVVHCDDDKSDLFQSAKNFIRDLTTEEFTKHERLVSAQLQKNGWFAYTDVLFLKVREGRAAGIRAIGVGSNKQKYQRAAALALAIAVQMEHPSPTHGYLPIWVVKAARGLFESLRRTDQAQEPPESGTTSLAAPPPTRARDRGISSADRAAGQSQTSETSAAARAAGPAVAAGGQGVALPSAALPSPVSEQAVVPERSVGFWVQTVEEYEAPGEGYLSLRSGSILFVQHDDHEGCYYGFRHGCEEARGWFPAPNVRPIVL